VWLSKVGPYHNPQETYSYYALPFCKPEIKFQPETRIGVSQLSCSFISL